MPKKTGDVSFNPKARKEIQKAIQIAKEDLEEKGWSVDQIKFYPEGKTGDNTWRIYGTTEFIDFHPKRIIDYEIDIKEGKVLKFKSYIQPWL